MTEISVCVGTACHLKGSYNVVQTFRHKLEEHQLHDQVKLSACFCNKQCQQGAQGVSVSTCGQNFDVFPDDADEFFDDVLLPLVK